MTAAEIDAIAGGYHGDPFAVLGPHRVSKSRGAARWEVRAFLPQAKSAAVLLDDKATLMTKAHADGLFVARLDGEPRL